jgi:hypothetical protein
MGFCPLKKMSLEKKNLDLFSKDVMLFATLNMLFIMRKKYIDEFPTNMIN